MTAVQASGVRVARAGKGISGENSHGGRKKLHRASGGRSRASLNAGAIMGGEEPARQLHCYLSQDSCKDVLMGICTRVMGPVKQSSGKSSF